MFGCYCCVLVFFQAEDGIRDLVRSRGLGDVYKRQEVSNAGAVISMRAIPLTEVGQRVGAILLVRDISAVSYTHLTLPTSDLV